MTMRLFEHICAGLLLLPATFIWSQVDNTTGNVGTDSNDSRMLTPPPVSGQSYPTLATSEERSNYLRGGLSFTSAYTDNAVGSLTGHPVSDVSYSLAPFVSLD